MQRIEVITGEERRRVWTEEMKDEILAAAFAPGASVTAVARKYDMTKATIYRWRIERSQSKGLAQVVVAPSPATVAAQGTENVIEIVIGRESRIRIPLDTPLELVATLIKAVGRQ